VTSPGQARSAGPLLPAGWSRWSPARAAQGAVLTYGQQRLGPLLPLVLVCGVAALSLRGFSREG